MAVGNIKLSDRWFMLRSANSYRQYPVNQMAAKIGQGQSEYGDNTSWDAWIVDDWQDGIGQRAQSSGMLYSEVDSRVPNQVVLPPLLRLADTRTMVNSVTDLRYMPASISSVITVGTPLLQKISIYIDASAGYTITHLWFYLRTNVNVNVKLYNVDVDKTPFGAEEASGIITPVSADQGFRWYRVAISNVVADEYAIELSTDGVGQTFDVACGESYTNAVTGIYTGVWETTTDGYPAFFANVHAIGAEVSDIVRFNNATYAAVGSQLYKYDEANGDWAAVGAARSTTITDLEVWGSTLYIGLGDSTNYDTMSTGEVYANGSVPGRLFYAGGGYLWRAVNGDAYYMGSAGTWSSAIAVGPPEQKIRAFAELDGYTYASIDSGLVNIADGDFARGTTQFGSADQENGVGMTSHQAALYVPAGGQLLQFSVGSARNIWTQRKDELPGWVNGRVAHLAAMINWPIVAVNADSSTGFDSVYAWQQVGWHFLAQLPQGIVVSCLAYDRPNQRLWIGTTNGLFFHIYVSDYLINPYYDANYEFQPFGWFETDWFSAGLLEAVKDIESVYLRGRNLSSGQSIDVYWQDDTSGTEVFLVDEDGNNIGEGADVIGETEELWAHLGTFTQDREEQRFELGVNRPATKEIKLGFLLSTTGVSGTPKLEAHRLKYHMMVRDWWGWDVPIEISGNSRQAQTMLDGEPSPYTSAEQKAYLDDLVKQVGPLLFTDLDGTVYEVKIRNASFTPDKIEYIAGAQEYFGTYVLSIEQTYNG